METHVITLTSSSFKHDSYVLVTFEGIPCMGEDALPSRAGISVSWLLIDLAVLVVTQQTSPHLVRSLHP